MGVAYQPPKWDIVLPVGISFYTFATLSYTLDVYLRRAKPAKHFLDYALFVTFFPHLVAGPIMRPTELVPQFASKRRATAAPALLRPVADDPRPVPEGGACRRLPRSGGGEGLRRARGRADGARRLGRDPGVQRADLLRLRRLFDARRSASRCASASPCPTISASLTRRSASPTSGDDGTSPCRAGCAIISTFRWAATSTARRAPTRALMGTMLLGGLWHGAAWTFVVWGGLHGTYLAVERWLKARFAGLEAGPRVRSSGWGCSPMSWSTSPGCSSGRRPSPAPRPCCSRWPGWRTSRSR